MKKLEFSDNIGFERLLDETTALLKVKVCSSRENAHDLYIEDDALIEASASVLGKPIVAKYDEWSKDVMGHEKKEIPIGYVIDNQTPSFVKEENGALSLVVYSILWKEYVPEIFELFVEKQECGDDPIKKVSMEIYLNEVAIDDENNERILKFQFKGITLLGDTYTPACELAHAEMVAFTTRAKQAEILFSLDMARKNIEDEKEEEMKVDTIQETFVEPVEEEKVEPKTTEENVSMEAPPVGTESKEEEAKEEEVETPEEEADMGCKQDMATDEPVDYQAKFEALETQFSALQAEMVSLREANQVLEAKFAEAAETEKAFAIEQVLMKFESKLSKDQIADFKERSKEVKPQDANAFCNEIKAFVADIIVQANEVEPTENRMSILQPELTQNKNELGSYTW